MPDDLQNIEAEIHDIATEAVYASGCCASGCDGWVHQEDEHKAIEIAAQKIAQLCSSRELAARLDELGCVQLQYGGRFEAITYVDGEALTVEERYKQLQAGVAGVSPAHSKALKKKEK